MKKISMGLFILVLTLSFSASAFAFSVELVGYKDAGNGGYTSARYGWKEVRESENVASDPNVTASNYSVWNVAGGTPEWNKGLWIWGSPGYVQTVFSAPSKELFVQFE